MSTFAARVIVRSAMAEIWPSPLTTLALNAISRSAPRASKRMFPAPLAETATPSPSPPSVNVIDPSIVRRTMLPSPPVVVMSDKFTSTIALAKAFAPTRCTETLTEFTVKLVEFKRLISPPATAASRATRVRIGSATPAPKTPIPSAAERRSCVAIRSSVQAVDPAVKIDPATLSKLAFPAVVSPPRIKSSCAESRMPPFCATKRELIAASNSPPAASTSIPPAKPVVTLDPSATEIPPPERKEICPLVVAIPDAMTRFEEPPAISRMLPDP